MTRLVFRVHEAYQARKPGTASPDDGLPLPPPRLRVLVAGIADAGYFLTSGRRTAEIVAESAQRGGRDIHRIDSILDFGCGCGRVARHWPGLTGAEVSGCDYNPELVAWVDRNLPHVSAAQNQLEPPLPFDAARFELIYSISVFTHLTEPLQRRWLQELARVIRPGGLLLFTTHGQGHADRLAPDERERFDAGELIVQFDEMEGSNWCAAFHPEAYVRERMLGTEFVLRDFRPGDADLPQDGWTVERVELK